MKRIQNTVFISYRRSDEAWALLIYKALRQRGFDVFIDFLGIGAGAFEGLIFDNIDARAHFLILLTPNALERIDVEDDWMRREALHAMRQRRNIVPVMLEGFSFESPLAQTRLTQDLAPLKGYNGLRIPSGYFDAAIQQLHERYLSLEIDTVIRPLSDPAAKAAVEQQAAADEKVGSTGNGRTAIIAVPDFSSGLRGSFATSIAQQLAAISYSQMQPRDLILEVPPFDPAASCQFQSAGNWLSRVAKTLRESWRSDFLDDAIFCQSGDLRRRNAPLEFETTGDVGVRYTDYLLAQAEFVRGHSAAAPAKIAAATVDGEILQADVLELYWADLASAPSALVRLATELIAVLFGFSRSSANALSLSERLSGGGELSWLSRVQRCADWLYSRVLALLALQLVMCTLILAPALFFAAHANGTRVTATAIAAVGVAAALVWLKDWRWRAALPLGALLGVAVWTLLGTGLALLAVMLAWLAALSLVYHRFLAFCEQRFRAMLGIGWMLFLVTLGCIVLFGRSSGFADTAGWINGTLGALEALLLGHAALWSLLALLVAASVLLSEWALWRGDRAGRDHRQTLVTARLGLFSSVGAFLVLLMIGFSLSAWALRSLLGCESYEPWWFIGSPAAMCASDFLDWRAQRNNSSFAMVALLLLALLGFVALVFLPSILREMRLSLPSPAGLGRWLSAGYRAIERLVRLWGLAVALGAAAIALLLLMSQFARSGLLAYPAAFDAHLKGITDAVELLSKNWIGTIIFWLAVGMFSLVVFGRVDGIQAFRAIRGPLDLLLGRDSHLSEYPRNAVCRVRTIERFVALLDHTCRQGYRRLVFVTHGQGTVIAAELLRYLQQRDALDRARPIQDGQFDTRKLREWMDQVGPRLLTVGCPLRQTYALRFPMLYSWVLCRVQADNGEPWFGPQPHELGLQSWSNIWASGDYAGRWLWAAPDSTRPVALQVDAARYDGTVWRGQDERGREWKDVCVGGGAHWQYFDLEEKHVAEELLELALKGSGENKPSSSENPVVQPSAAV